MSQSGAKDSAALPSTHDASPATKASGTMLTDALKTMRESYEIAKKRSSEVAALAVDCPSHLKSRLTLTSKVYLSLSTIFYSTLTLFQLNDLNSFVKESSLQLPTSLLDLKEWEEVLLLARDLRLKEAHQMVAAALGQEAMLLRSDVNGLKKKVDVQVESMVTVFEQMKLQIITVLKEEERKIKKMEMDLIEKDAIIEENRRHWNSNEQISNDESSRIRSDYEKQISEQKAQIIKECEFEYEEKLIEVNRLYEDRIKKIEEQHNIKIGEVQGKMNAVKAELDRKNEEKAALEAKLDSERALSSSNLSESMLAHKSMVSMLNQSILELKSKNSDLIAKYSDETSSAKDKMTSVIADMNSNIASIRSNYEQSLSKRDDEISKRDDEISLLKSDLADSKRELAKRQSEQENQLNALNSELTKSRSELEAFEIRLRDSAYESKTLTAQLEAKYKEDLSNSKNKLTTEIIELQQIIQEQENSLTIADEIIKKQRGDAESIMSASKAKDLEIIELKSDVERREREISDNSIQVSTRVNSKYRALEGGLNKIMNVLNRMVSSFKYSYKSYDTLLGGNSIDKAILGEANSKDEGLNDFKEGDRVDCRYKGKDKWFPGKIASINNDNTVNILYDDGEEEKGVKYELVKRYIAGEREGQKVYCRFKGRKQWFLGKISRDRRDGTFDVVYEDGESEAQVPEDLIRTELPPVDAKITRSGLFKEDDKVECRYRGRARYYPAKVAHDRADGTFDIAYDDGESEVCVPEDLIREIPKANPDNVKDAAFSGSGANHLASISLNSGVLDGNINGLSGDIRKDCDSIIYELMASLSLAAVADTDVQFTHTELGTDEQALESNDDHINKRVTLIETKLFNFIKLLQHVYMTRDRLLEVYIDKLTI